MLELAGREFDEVELLRRAIKITGVTHDKEEPLCERWLHVYHMFSFTDPSAAHDLCIKCKLNPNEIV